MKTQYDKILANISDDILWIADTKGLIKYANQTAKNILKKQNDKLDIAHFMDEATSEHLKIAIKKSIQTQNIQKISFQFDNKSYIGKIYPLNTTEVAMSIRDVSETKNLTHTLNEVMQKLTFASQIARIGYWELDLVKKEISWSSEMFRIFGIEEENIPTKKNIIRQQMHPQDLPRYKDKLKKIMKTGQAEEGIVRIIRPNKTIIYCRYKAEYINYTPYNRKIAGTFQDLTEFIEIQRALETAKNTAERLNREKSYFLAQASHDLQQPVSAMGMFINNLLNADLTGKQQILVGKIHDSAQSLRHLLNNLLDFSNLETGAMKPQLHQFDLYDVVEKIRNEIQYLLQEKNINFQMLNCHQKLITDSFLVERILRNYINNAIKYTKNKILVGCLQYKDKIKIMVIDNGVGIDTQEQQKIFEPYYQSPKIKDNRSKGSGLGLAIVKKNANLLEAKVGVESKLGHGSLFYLELKQA